VPSCVRVLERAIVDSAFAAVDRFFSSSWMIETAFPRVDRGRGGRALLMSSVSAFASADSPCDM